MRALGRLLAVVATNNQFFSVGFPFPLRQRDVLLVNRGHNVLRILPDTVVSKQIELPLKLTGNQAAPSIAAAPQAGELSNPPVAVQVNLVSAVAISHPHWRHARHYIVVVNPTVVADLCMAYVFFASDTWRAQSVQFLGIAGNRAGLTA